MTDHIPPSVRTSSDAEDANRITKDFLELSKERAKLCPVIMLTLLSDPPQIEDVEKIVSGETGSASAFVDLRSLSREEALQTVQDYRSVLDIYEEYLVKGVRMDIPS
jgi:hypothetical protein